MSANDNEERRRLLNDSPNSPADLQDSEYDSEEPSEDPEAASNSLNRDDRKNMLDQTNLTGVVNDSFDESRAGTAMSGITEIFAKLKMQIEGHADEKYNIPLTVIRQIYDKLDKDRSVDDYEKIEFYFWKNPIFQTLRTQVDHQCIKELLKSLQLERKPKGTVIYRYGQPNGNTGYFLLDGCVSLKVPTLEQVSCSSHDDLITYLCQNFKDIIWHKIDDGEELREECKKMMEEKNSFGGEIQVQHKGNKVIVQKAGRLSTKKSATSIELAAKAAHMDQHTHEYDIRQSFENNTTFDAHVPGNLEAIREIVTADKNLTKSPSGRSFKPGTATQKNFNGKQTFAELEKQHKNALEVETPSTAITTEIWTFKAVEVIQSKQNFGEMALVDDKKLRSATVTCETDCEILILSRDTYEHTLDKALRRDRERRIQMLQQFRIFKHMTNKQLERVIPRIQQKTINRGAVLYSEGEDADGVYFIANGAFEVTHRKHHIRDIEKATEQMRIDPIARQQLKKKTIVQHDKALDSVRVAILSSGECFGLEECQLRCNRLMPGEELTPRKVSVTCVEHQSKVLFISYLDFSDHVLTDPQTGKEIKFESLIKQYFKEARDDETQRTIWDGKMAEKSVLVDGQGLPDNYQDINTEIKRKKTHLFQSKQHVKDKYHAQYMGIMVNNLKQRTIDHLESLEKGESTQIEKKQAKVKKDYEEWYKLKAQKQKKIEANNAFAHVEEKKKSRKQSTELNLGEHSRDTHGIYDAMGSIFSQESSRENHTNFSQHNQSIDYKDQSRFLYDQSKSTQPTAHKKSNIQNQSNLAEFSNNHNLSMNMLVEDNTQQQSIVVENGMHPGHDSIQSFQQPYVATERLSQDNVQNVTPSGQYIDQQIAKHQRSVAVNQDKAVRGSQKILQQPIPFNQQSQDHVRSTNQPLNDATKAQIVSFDGTQIPAPLASGSKGSAGITQVVHQVVSGRISLDSHEMRASQILGQDSNQKSVQSDKFEQVAVSNQKADRPTLQEQKNKKKEEIQKRVAADGEAAELEAEQSGDFPLAKVLTPLSGHRFQSERVVQGEVDVTQKLKLKKSIAGKQSPLKVPGSKDSKKQSNGKYSSGLPQNGMIRPKEEVRYRTMQTTNEEREKLGTEHRTNENDIIYAEGGPNRADEEAVRVIQVAKRRVSSKHYNTNSGGVQLPQEIINILPFEQIQPHEKEQTIDANRLPQIKLAARDHPGILSARGSPLGLTKTLRNMKGRSAPQGRNEQQHQYQTIQPQVGRNKMQMKGIPRKASFMSNFGMAPFQNQNLTNLEQRQFGNLGPQNNMLNERGLNLIPLSTRDHPVLPPIEYPGASTHITPQLAGHTIDFESRDKVFAPCATNNVRFKKMLLGKKRKDKQKNTALQKAVLKQDGISSYRTGLHPDSQANTTNQTQYMGSPNQTAQAPPNLQTIDPRLDDPQLKLHSREGENIETAQMTNQQTSREQLMDVQQMGQDIKHDMQQSFILHSGSGDVNAPSNFVKEQQRVHTYIPQPNYEDGGQSPDGSINNNTDISVDRSPYQSHILHPAGMPTKMIASPSPVTSEESRPKFEQQHQIGMGGLSQQAAQATGDLMQKFLLQPRGGGPTIEDFKNIQYKYHISAYEAYQICLQQIQLQRLILQPPTAATVVKISHHSYTSHIQTKREEVNMFRSRLMQKFSLDRTAKNAIKAGPHAHMLGGSSMNMGVSTQTNEAKLKIIQEMNRNTSSGQQPIKIPQQSSSSQINVSQPQMSQMSPQIMSENIRSGDQVLMDNAYAIQTNENGGQQVLSAH